MRIVTTGAAGFMLSHLSEYLANQGHTVMAIDNFSVGSKENIPERCFFKQVDLRDKKQTERLVEDFQPELIYHGAAWAHEGLSQFMPILITENNYNAFLNLIVPALRNGMKRIVVFSSMSVYGAQKAPFDEKMPRRPEDIYAVAKSAMEDATEILADVHGFDYTIIRPHNVYGPRQSLRDPYRNVVAIFINRLMKNQPPIIYGDGKQTRAFTYVDDVTPYVAKCGFLEETKGEIINIGPLEEYSINELAEQVLKAFKSDLKPLYVPDRPREVKDAYCTNDKAKRLLNYHTSTPFEKGITQMVQWAKRMGPQEFKYLDDFELKGGKLPITWKEKLI